MLQRPEYSERRALITGISGQDGAYLARELLNRGLRVYGTIRSEKASLQNLDSLGVREKVELFPFDYSAVFSPTELLQKIQPDLIYNLAALSSLSLSEADRELTLRVNYESPLTLFQAALEQNNEARLFQASSALVFSGTDQPLLMNEHSERHPETCYALAKNLLDTELSKLRSQGAFASTGIMFNHESPLRGQGFVSQKIVCGLAKIKTGKGEAVQLRSFDDARDWSHAEDFVRSIAMISFSATASDWVISSGTLHTVWDWIRLAALHLGFDPERRYEEEQDIAICHKTGKVLATAPLRNDYPKKPLYRIGDSSRLRNELGWRPDFTFERMVREMTDHAVSSV